MTTRKINLNNADQEIIKRLYWLLYQNQSKKTLHEALKSTGAGLPTDTILEMAAKIWQCDKQGFYGKVDHKNYKEKIKKYSFFAACFLFGNDDAYYTAKKFGVKGTMAWGAHQRLSQEIGHRAGFSGPFVQDFFLALNNALPGRLQELHDFAMPQKPKTLYEEVSEHAAIIAEYAAGNNHSHERFMQLIKEQHALAIRLSAHNSQVYAQIQNSYKDIEIKTATTVYLVCKNDVKIKLDGHKITAKGLIFLDRYTSPGLVKSKEGYFCYRINELNGQLHLAERFHVCKKPHPQTKK